MSDADDAIRRVTTLDLASTAGGANGGTVLQRSGESGNALPIGARLGEFEIVGIVGEGGFGIVYRAFDHSLRRQVAVKEYLPASLAMRGKDTTVRVKSAQLAETFNIGLRSFVNEARLLAQFDHPALVKVFRFWEAHGTAYMVMPYYEGVTLEQALQKRAAPPDEAWLRKLLTPLLEALEVVHRANCFHRDIAPDNILLLAHDRPLLLDFGAARRVIGDMTQALTVILKPGYAPIEQYGESAKLRQGAWTDLYALGAVVYYCIIGNAPPAAVGRLLEASHRPLSEAAAGRYSARFLAAIDRALSPMPGQRPQSIAAFRADLGIGPSVAHEAGSKTVQTPKPFARRKPRWTVIVGALFGVIIAVSVGYILTIDRREATPQMSPVAPKPAATSRESVAPQEAELPKPVPQAATVPSEPKPVPQETTVPDELRPEAPKGQPEARPLVPPSTGEPAKQRPRERTEPRKPPVTVALPERKPASPAPTAERPPASTVLKSSERCVALINRAQLGEPVSAADLEYLKKECR